MKLRNLGKSQTEVISDNGNQLLFSYETPVAAFNNEMGWIKTSSFYSKTTSRHIRSWLPEQCQCREVDQSILDQLAEVS